MYNINIDEWVDGYKVRAFPIDDKQIYFNVQYFKAGTSIERPPQTDKTVYITVNENGLNVLENFIDSLTNYVIRLKCCGENKKVILTF